MATSVALLDVTSGARLRELGGRGSAAAYTAGGLVLTAGRAPAERGGQRGLYPQVGLCRPETGQLIRRTEADGLGLAVSGCGRLFATGRVSIRHMFPRDEDSVFHYPDAELRVGEAASGRDLLKFARQDTTALALSPDGRTLAAGDREGAVFVWDLVRVVGPTSVPADRELDRLVRALGGDAEPAFRAQAALVLAGDRAVAALRAAVAPARSDVVKKAARLIVELDSEAFAERKRAFEALRKLGDEAEPLLRRALRDKPSLEVRLSVERLLAAAGGPRLSARRLQARRAIAVLQQIASAEARKALRRLARGADGAAVTQEARAALRWPGAEAAD